MLSRRTLKYDEKNQRFIATSIIQDLVDNPGIRDVLLKVGKLSMFYNFVQSSIDD